ncbi:BlaI/MecI/CopY family transcriptional regulator [Cedecea sp. VD23]|uniref:BlaI/MecI/CopY family transcriptional regulator n=1 Tax=unclassified Cedecea TaxID=2649846 RepID=UPI003FA57F09
MRTLREYIRSQQGSFSAKDILNGYLPEKPTTRLDSVISQLNWLVERGELRKERTGRRVTYSPVNSGVSMSMSSLFNELLMRSRNRRLHE